jgi:hypothetical protein
VLAAAAAAVMKYTQVQQHMLLIRLADTDMYASCEQAAVCSARLSPPLTAGQSHAPSQCFCKAGPGWHHPNVVVTHSTGSESVAPESMAHDWLIDLW